MQNLLARFYRADAMLPKSRLLGEIPSTRRLYGDTLFMAWPAIMETVLTSTVSLADTIMVGRLGSYAIAAVGLTHQPRFMALSLFMAINIGVTAIVARRRGENDANGANACLRQAFIVTVAFGLVISALFAVFAAPLLGIMGAQDDTIGPASDYFRILMIGNIFNVLALVITAAQRGAGNTRISMRTSLVANLTNILFNFLLIEGRFGFPRLEVKGAAIATTIGYVVAFFIAAFSVSKTGAFLCMRIKERFLPDKKTLKLLFTIGGSASVEQFGLRVGMVLFAVIIARLGTDAFAAHNICMSLMTFSFSFGDGLSIAAASLIGQNLGRKRPDLSILYGKACQRIGLMIGALLCACFFFFGKTIVSFYTDDATVLSLCAPILIIIGVCVPAQISLVVFTGGLRGAGDAMFVAVLSLALIFLRVGISYALCYPPVGLGLIGAWIAVAADQYFRLIVSGRRFKGGKWTGIVI